MQNIFKRILSCGMALLMCLGITTVVHSTVTESYSYVADAATDYYADITATSGKTLSGQLHDLIVKTHKKYTSYSECNTYASQTDPALDGGSGIMEFYTHETIKASGTNAGQWNREHVWCKSNSNSIWETSGGGSDLHHIRPSEVRLNGTRSNYKYGEVSGGTAAYSKTTSGANSLLGGYLGGGAFEPLDNVKGDVARICMYVYLHYNNASNVGGTVETSAKHGNLSFSYNIAGSESEAIALLLKWNKLDPVDDIEKNRNDVIYDIQGNRNPFIDNETYADAIWGNGTATEVPVDPSVKVTSVTVSPSSLNLTVGQTQKLTATVTPANASQSVKWNSDNPLVASVSSDGVVTANAEGIAKIYATSTSDSTKKASAAVTVAKSGGTVTPTPTDGGTITIDSSKFLPGSGQYEFYYWESGDIGGMAYIFGGNDALQFNVSKKSYYLASNVATKGPIKSVTVVSDKQTTSDKEWKLLTSDTPYGEVDKKPTDGHDQGTKSVSGTKSVTWTVSGNDTYFALTYEAKSGACYLDSVIVEYGGSQGTTPVTPPSAELEGIEIVPSTVALSVGQTKTLTVLAEPLEATAEVNWSTSDSSVATVSNGVVTAKAAGRATITATAKNDSSIKSTANVTVSEGAVTPSDTVTVTLDSFTLSDGYGFKEWSQGGFGGIGFIYGGDVRYPENAPTSIQLNAKNQQSYYIASNVSAGNIKSVTVKGIAGSSTRECSLWTSNTAYGEFTGTPTNGTNQGVKTLSNSGVTWTLDGSEKYFAVVCETKTGATNIVSIEIVYEANGQGVYVPDIDEAKLQSFHEAVENAIDAVGSDVALTEKAAAIKAAEDILATMTADEKVEALEDINELTTAKLLYELELNGDEEIDLDKILEFMDAVDAINNDGTIEEREEQIAAADAILETMNASERASEGADDYISTLNAAKIKLEQDKKKAEEAENPPVPPEPPVNQKLVAFHNAVEAIKSDGTIEEREEQISAADAIYATLTANEKAEALEDIALLTAAKAKLEQDKNGSGGDDTTVDQTKLTNFHNAVEAIPANGTLDERLEALQAAYNILVTFNDAEKEAAADDIEAFGIAYQKYLEDADGSDDPTVDQTKLTNFHNAVEAIPANGTLEERLEAIEAAAAILDTFNDAEAEAAADDILAFAEAYQKYLLDAALSQNAIAFRTAVAAIPSNGTLEAKFNALKSAIAAYQNLTSAEKATVSQEIETLDAAIASYNATVNSYNSSAEDSSDIAVNGMRSFL